MLDKGLFLLKKENENLKQYLDLGIQSREKLLRFSYQEVEKNEDFFDLLNELYLKKNELLKKILNSLKFHKNLNKIKKNSLLKTKTTKQQNPSKYQKERHFQEEKKQKLIQNILNQDEELLSFLKKIKLLLLKDIQKLSSQKRQMSSYKCELNHIKREKPSII